MVIGKSTTEFVQIKPVQHQLSNSLVQIQIEDLKFTQNIEQNLVSPINETKDLLK